MKDSLCDAIFGDGNQGNGAAGVAVVDLGRDGKEVTYAQLQQLVDATRATANIAAGDNVVLVMPNSLELIVGLLAIWADGAAAAPLNPAYTAAEFKVLFDDLGVKKALVLPGDDRLQATLKAASADLHIISVDVNSGAMPSGDRSSGPWNRDNGTALYLHTSGTTGKPKAVPLRHSNLLQGARNVMHTYRLTTTDRTYLLQVLFHIHGIVAAMLAPLLSGGSVVIPPGGSLDTSRAWFDFDKHGCNWVTATPSILQTLLAAPSPDRIPTIRFMRSCSSPLLPNVFEALRARFQCPVLEAYAMTEASHQMCSNRLDLFESGTVGTESGGTKICVWRSGERACELGDEGEVCVSGENVMGGYEGVSEETNSKAFWNGVDERGNQAKWFRTGDLGVLSTDGKRRLTLIGRSSEMVNRGGEKISPIEVDEAIMLAAEGVKEAASFAVDHEFYGQEIEAAVVLKDGVKLTEEKLQQSLAQRLAGFKIPKRIHFCEDKIPKGPTGKIQRKNLAQLFAAERGPSGKETEQVRDGDVYEVIDKALGLKPGQSKLQPTATLLELGADSMGLTKIVAGVEEATGKKLDIAKLFSFPSIDGVVSMVDADKSGSNGDSPMPEAFSMLSLRKSALEHMCREAGVQRDDVEDAFPLSSSQRAYSNTLIGGETNNNFLWMLNRYELAKGVDKEQLLRALVKLQDHEDTLRWTLAVDPNGGWNMLQLRRGVDNRVEEYSFKTAEVATRFFNDRLSSCRHRSGAKTVQLYVLEIDQEIELAFIQSHLCTEGQGRAEVLDALTKAYNNEKMDDYPPYSLFVQRYPAGNDPPHKLEFWRQEKAAVEYGEGRDWNRKQQALLNSTDWVEESLETLGAVKSVSAPFQKLSMATGMTLPILVESILALSLAMYFAPQDAAFTRGHMAYDRAVSLRTVDPAIAGVRAVTGGYHPNFPSLELAKHSLWTYLQHFKAMTRLREQNLCLNSSGDVANHSVAFTWRFHNDDIDEDDDDDERSTGVASRGQLIAGVKDEAMAMRSFKMCLVNANRKGANGATVAIGFHKKWLEQQRQRGSSRELIDIYIEALRFVAESHESLSSASFEDVHAAVLAAHTK